jgi:hypothetical protein
MTIQLLITGIARFLSLTTTVKKIEAPLLYFKKEEFINPEPYSITALLRKVIPMSSTIKLSDKVKIIISKL